MDPELTQAIALDLFRISGSQLFVSKPEQARVWVGRIRDARGGALQPLHGLHSHILDERLHVSAEASFSRPK